MTEPARFVVCIEDGEYRASLERWKVYRALRDADAERHGQLRVMDESGEDYLYPRAYFAPVELSLEAARLYGSQPVRDR